MRPQHLLGALLPGLMMMVCCTEEVDAPPKVDIAVMLQQPVSCKEVVATVDGRPICAEVLREMVQRPGNKRSKAQLLQDLILGEIGAETAIERGYAQTPEMSQLQDRFATRLWMREEIDRPLAPEALSDEDIKRYYEKNYFFYKDPELRDADHLLVQPSPEKWSEPGTAPKEVQDAAFALAEEIHRDILSRNEKIRDHNDFKRVKARWDAKTPEHIILKVEKLPPAPIKPFGDPKQPGYLPGFVKPFAEALFAMSPGELSKPVRTVFGTHILVLEKVLPPTSISLEDADSGIREFLSKKRRKTHFVKTSKKLNTKARLLSNDKLWEEQMKEDQGASKATQ